MMRRGEVVEGVDGSAEHLKPPQPSLPPSLWEPGAGAGSQAKDPTSPTPSPHQSYYHSSLHQSYSLPPPATIVLNPSSPPSSPT